MKKFKPLSQLLAAVAVAATLGILFGTNTARAEEITVSGAISPTLTDWRETVAVPQFDPVQGTLYRVEIQITGSITGNANMESLDSQPAIIDLTMASRVDLLGTDGSVIISAEPAASTSRSFTAFDGDNDFAGSSGDQIAGLIGFDESVSATLTEPSDLERFRGTGDIDILLVASANALADGAGNIALRFETLTSATLAVTYIFEADTDLVCPAESLPDLKYMGESPVEPGSEREFRLEGDTDGYDGFLVKQIRPFGFSFQEGTVDQFGVRTIDVGPQRVKGELRATRVYACAGLCDLTSVYEDSIEIGEDELVPGQEVNIAIIDDDIDDRFDFFYKSEDLAALGENANPENLPSSQKIFVRGPEVGLVEFVTFNIPSAGMWNFYAADSVGVVKICIDEPVEDGELGEGEDVVDVRPMAYRFESYSDLVNDVRQGFQLFLPVIQ